MKIRIPNYIFSSTTGKITFSDYTTILLDSILLITNVTSNIIIYNFADPSAGGTVSGNILTLTYNTTSMNDNDKLLIYYDEPNIPATDATIQALQDQVTLLKRMARLMESNAVVDSGSRQMVVLGYGTLPTAGTLTVAGTIGGNAGANGYGNSYGASTNPYTITTATAPVINSEFPVDQRWRIANDARTSFAVGIRNNIT
jgi:hypothetical protein